MKHFTINESDEGLRFNKYLNRIMPNAGSGFLFKMLRKKNITLNDRKAEGNETLHKGDVVSVYFSDETIQKFQGKVGNDIPAFSKHSVKKEWIVYEDDNLLIVYKPAGILSQKDSTDTDSINEMLLDYMVKNGSLTAEKLSEYKPGICNRLDRNTAGLILFAKNARASRELNVLLRERKIDKIYFAVVNGIMTEFIDSKLYLSKEEMGNIVRISETPYNEESVPVHTDFTPVTHNTDLSLLRIRLHTGKSHQIRSVLAYLKHPILGDPKYINADDRYALRNGYYRNLYHIHGQQLLAYALHFPKNCDGYFAYLSDRTFRSPIPADFASVVSGEFDCKGDINAVMEIPRA